jgi:hypothetical protein
MCLEPVEVQSLRFGKLSAHEYRPLVASAVGGMLGHGGVLSHWRIGAATRSCRPG